MLLHSWKVLKQNALEVNYDKKGHTNEQNVLRFVQKLLPKNSFTNNSYTELTSMKPVGESLNILWLKFALLFNNIFQSDKCVKCSNHKKHPETKVVKKA